jgi:hypothetical protein
MPVQILGQKSVISKKPKITAKDAMDIILPTGIKVAVYPGFDSVEVKRLAERQNTEPGSLCHCLCLHHALRIAPLF